MLRMKGIKSINKTDLCNGDAVWFICSWDYVFKYYIDERGKPAQLLSMLHFSFPYLLHPRIFYLLFSLPLTG
jgi:hypothetical protein